MKVYKISTILFIRLYFEVNLSVAKCQQEIMVRDKTSGEFYQTLDPPFHL